MSLCTMSQHFHTILLFFAIFCIFTHFICGTILTTDHTIYFSKPITAPNFYSDEFAGGVKERMQAIRSRFEAVNATATSIASISAPYMKLTTTLPPMYLTLCPGVTADTYGVVFNNKCYMMDPMYLSTWTQHKQTLTDAGATCLSLTPPADLGMIYSEEENNFVKAMLRYLRVEKYLLGFEMSDDWANYETHLPFSQFVDSNGMAVLPGDNALKWIYVDQKGWRQHSNTDPMPFFCVRDL